MSMDDNWKDGAPPLPPGGPAPYAPNPWTPAPPDPLADARPAVGGVYDPMPPPEGRTREKNWMGVTSLVFGIIGGVVLALIFGLLSLSANRQGKADNKALAIAGMATAGAWVVVAGLGIAAVVLLGGDSISLTQAQPGDCFTSNPAAIEDLAEGYYDFEPCSADTNGIVYFITALPSTVAYPDASTASELLDACTTDVAVAGIDGDIAADYYIEYFIGASEDWNAGDHTIVCGLSTTGTLDYDAVPSIEPHMADA